MLIVASDNIFHKMNTDSEKYNIHRCFGAVIAVSDDYTVSQLSDGLFIYCGLSCFSGLTADPTIPMNYEAKKNHSLVNDAFFLMVSIQHDGIKCCRSLYRNKDIYYWNRGEDYIISTDLHAIATATQNQDICTDFLPLFVNNSPAASYISPVSSVRKLEGGNELIYSRGAFDTCTILSLAAGSGNYLETMIGLLKSVTRGRNVHLHYSGGLDSTMLLLLLKDAGISFKALHYDSYAFEDDSEKKQAALLCEKYGVECHIIKPTLHLLNESGKASHPMDISAFHTEFDCDTFSLSELAAPNALVLDGQGGDSLFVQNPSEKVGYDFLRKGKILSAYSRMSDLSHLKNRNITEMVLSNTRRLFRKGVNRDLNPVRHSLAQSIDQRLPQYDYTCDLINMMEKMPLAGTNNYTSFSPILSLSSVRTFMSYSYHENYSDEYDRLKIRNLLYSRFREPAVYEKRKRSSVNLLYQMLKRQKDFLRSVIEESPMPELAGFDISVLRASLETNASVRIDENAVRLLRLADAYRYYKSLKLV